MLQTAGNSFRRNPFPWVCLREYEASGKLFTGARTFLFKKEGGLASRGV
jgi:hypothetical protein